MVKTSNGFEIAELDFKFRGRGDRMGLQQSGALNLKIADLYKYIVILEVASRVVENIVQQDTDFQHSVHVAICKEYTRLLAASVVGIG